LKFGKIGRKSREERDPEGFTDFPFLRELGEKLVGRQCAKGEIKKKKQQLL